MNAENKENFKHYIDPVLMLNHLITRYGTEKSFIPKEIQEMENLRRPRKDDFRAIQTNFNKIQQNIKYISDQGEGERLESGVVRAIVESAFHEDLLREHNKELMAFMRACKPDILAFFGAL